MRFLVFLLFPLWAFSQNLKPGVYRDLKADKPLVLGKGEYTFINLEMKDLGKGVWMDGRKAKKIILQNCTFEGSGSGTAVLSSGDLTVSHSTFSNMREAVVQESPKGTNRKVSVLSNVFKDNGVSIRLSVEKGKAETDWKSYDLKSRIANPGQREALGSQYAGNPAWSSLAALPMYSYGLYYKQTADNVSHRFTQNIIRSTIANAGRYHVGIGNNGLNQKGIYSKNTLDNLSLGIRGLEKFRLYSLKNTFTNNEIAIGLYHDGNSSQPSTGYGLQIKCNTFIHELSDPEENTPQRKGLVIGQNVSVYELANSGNTDNQIGGANSLISGNPYPNANVWPTTSDRTQRNYDFILEEYYNLHDPIEGWVDPENWIAIENLSGTPVSYYRYENEFVKNLDPPATNVLFPNIPARIATGSSVLDPNVDYEFACDNFSDPIEVIFPSRIAVISEITKKQIINQEVQLSDPMPNPVQNDCRIQAFLPEATEHAVLQIMVLATGKILQNIVIEEKGHVEILLNLKDVPANIYSYRLIHNGKPLPAKKLAVIK